MTLPFKIRDKIYTSEEVALRYAEIMKLAVRQTKKDVINWILKYVPVRTGQLRDSLIRWINGNWEAKGVGFILDLQTAVEYALKISGDPAHINTWFEHSGAHAVANYYDHTGYILLDDPEAIINWFIEVEHFTRVRFQDNILIQTDNIFGG